MQSVVILALETATRPGSVALFSDGVVHASPGDPSRTHGQRLPDELLQWTSRHGRTLSDIDLFAVIAGPGSFTGLRVGMATIQGLAMTLSRRAVPVPTLEAIAFLWLLHNPSENRVVVPCLDGQRQEVFFCAYEASTAEALDGSRVLLPATVGTPAESAAQLSRHAPRGLVLVGDGALRHADEFSRQLPGAAIAAVPATLAEGAAAIAARQPARAVNPHALRPIYIRRPDAEVARDRFRGQASSRTDRGLPEGYTVTRAFGPQEIAAVEALQRRAFTNPWGAEAIRWELENTDVARLYVVRAADGDVIAYCACGLIFDELHINSLAVAERARRRGLADALLRQVMREAVADGAQSATLEVRRSNEPALALYAKLDFKVEAVRRDYYQDPREDALVLWNRRLPDTA